MVAIGHSHHSDRATHYHAEVMPVEDGQISFYVLTENVEGLADDAHGELTETLAYVDRLDRELAQPREVVFSPKPGESGLIFVTAVPDSLLQSGELSVVVPKIRLGGRRLNFSFTTAQSREPAASGKADEEP